jgi:hypothetical protein
MSFLNMLRASKIFRLLNRAAFPKAPKKIHDLRQAAKAEQRNGVRDPRSVAPKPPFVQGFNCETSQYEA